jgi:acetate kinase
MSPAPILVLNAGSSTLKYRVVDVDRDLAHGLVERIGEPGGPPDHAAAVASALGSVRDMQPVAVGHRVVHGGPDLTAPAVVDDAVLATIEQVAPLAPLHNPPAVACLRAARQAFAGVAHVAVFDTAFHATLAPVASTYAIDAEVARAYGLRRYGFHGISVRYVRDRAAQLLGRAVDELNLIVAHLGNGASVTAIERGSSVDTSMGTTPLPGLVMGTRCGDVDPSLPFLLARAGWALDDIESMLEHRSGLRGLCGDNDVRSVVARVEAGDAAARLAFDVYCHRLRQYLGAYAVTLGRLDAIVFTAGVGEHSAPVREAALQGLDQLGVRLDRAANAAATAGPAIVSTMDSSVAVCVLPTNEERAIAEETAHLLGLSGW